MTIHRRLSRLQQTAGAADPGCPVCRDRRGRTVDVTCEGLPDGTTTDAERWPAPCERCREIPEKVIRIVEVVVASCEDLARPAAEDRPGPARRAEGGRP